MPRVLKQPSKCTVACSYCRKKKIRCDGKTPCSNCSDHREVCIFPIIEPRSSQVKRKELSAAVLEGRLAWLEERLAESTSKTTLQPVEEVTSAANLAIFPSSDFGTLIDATIDSTCPTGGEDSDHFMLGHLSPPLTDDRDANFTSPTGISGNLEMATCSSEHSDGHSLFVDVNPKSSQSIAAGISQPETTFRTPSPTYQTYPGVPLSSHANIDTLNSSNTFGQLSDFEADYALEEEECMLSPEEANYEHHGSGSFLSICSEKGIRWVGEKIGPSEERIITSALRQFTTDVTRRLKLERKISTERTPEPDPETAWNYTRAYFKDSIESNLGIISQESFEERLTYHINNEHLNNQNPPKGQVDEESAWYALRNAVYASGCRLCAAQETGGGRTEHQRAWGYFENALSVHTELLYYPRTGFLATQAFLVMLFFAEGILSPSVEYMLCSIAVRLAQSIGLNRQPPKSLNLTASQKFHRSCVWWAIYTYDKTLAMRSGRPSCIDDDDISCLLPKMHAGAKETSVQFFNHVIRHGQILSAIIKNLYSVRASRQTSLQTIKIMTDLSRELELWRASTPPHLLISSSAKLSQPLHDLNMHYALYVHYGYHGCLAAIHNRYPWSTKLVDLNGSQNLCESALSSVNTVAASSRSIILATKHINLDMNTQVWEAFYHPVTALIYLFINVLRFPTLPLAASDVAILDIAAGHFARLEVATFLEISFPFSRDLADIARRKVKACKDEIDLCSNSSELTDTALLDQATFIETAHQKSMDAQIDDWNSFRFLLPNVSYDTFLDSSSNELSFDFMDQ